MIRNLKLIIKAGIWKDYEYRTNISIDDGFLMIRRSDNFRPRRNDGTVSPSNIRAGFYPRWTHGSYVNLSFATWLSRARHLWRSSQWAGPVVILKAPGYTSILHPDEIHRIEKIAFYTIDFRTCSAWRKCKG